MRTRSCIFFEGRRRAPRAPLLQLLALGLAAALFTVSAESLAGEPQPAGESAAPPYELEVDSDASEILSYESIAPRLAADLRVAVVRRSASPRARVSITVRYRGATGSLSVRADHDAGARVLEREVRAEGDSAAVQREAILLAGNLARDAAHELLDELAARRPSAEPPAPIAPIGPIAEGLPAEKRPVPEDRTFVTFAALYPLATNAGRPDVHASIATSLFYGRVGRFDVLDLGFGVAHAARGGHGAQITGVAAIAGGDFAGCQLSVGGNVSLTRLEGVQAATASNYARGELTGLQLSAGANVALGHVRGVQLGSVSFGTDVEGAQLGLVNVARHVKGAQLGLVNIAEKVDGAAIGLVSLSRDAIHPIAWTSNLAYTNGGIKFATKHFYTLVAIGFGTNESKLRAADLTFTAALGAHARLLERGLDLDLEVAYSDLDLERDSEANRAVHARLLPGWSFAEHLRLFAGGGVRIPIAFDQGSSAVRPEVVGGVQF